MRSGATGRPASWPRSRSASDAQSPSISATWRGIAWENRDNLGYALEGPEPRRLRRLRARRRRPARLDHRRRPPLHDPAQPAAAEHHAGARPGAAWPTSRPCAGMRNAQLRELGRLPLPLLRERGDRGFRRITWDEAYARIAARIRGSRPRRIAFFLTARGLTNEVYYVAQKVARFLGTNNIDNAARLCHSPSTGAMKRALGVAATHLQLPRLVGHRPDRLLRLQPGQRPAGGDEVPARGQAPRHARRAGQPATASRAWSATGCRRRRAAPSSAPTSPTTGSRVAQRRRHRLPERRASRS